MYRFTADDARALLTDWATAYLLGDAADRAELIGHAESNQGDPDYAAEHPGPWARVDRTTGEALMVTLWEGQLSVDRLTPGTEDTRPDCTVLATLEDVDSAAAALVSAAVRS